MYLLSFIRMGGRESNTYMFMLFHYKEGREFAIFFSQKGKKGGGNAGWSCLKNVDQDTFFIRESSYPFLKDHPF